ncbi:MAG: hypothetical protein EPN92_02210 [Chitinophagaceae bacterium]|nr:MAG: hypothetical protein EPN92_02210 [Chitinophagaceae bacterium]
MNRIREISGSGFLLPVNLTGRIIYKENFIFYQKRSFTLFTIMPSPVVIEGTISTDDERSSISILIRPDYQMIFALLTLAGIIVYGIFQLFGDFEKGIALIIPSVIILAFIHLFISIALRKLKTNFVSAFDLQ